MELGLRTQIASKLERESIYLYRKPPNKHRLKLMRQSPVHESAREIYADGDGTELMKMAIRMPDALK
jgi:hypothetical protein